MTYFHMGIHTIIGAKSFHCPVRDGKEWDQLAMVVRQTVRLAAMFCCLPCLLFAAPDLTLVQRTIFLEEVRGVSIALRHTLGRMHTPLLNVIESSLTGN